MTLHCSKDVKNFKNSMLDVDDIFKGWELKLGFSIFHIVRAAVWILNPKGKWIKAQRAQYNEFVESELKN